MAIQIPNPGTGNGATGDNEFLLWSKVKGNFEDQTNAASRLVGTGVNQVPLAQEAFKATFNQAIPITDGAASAALDFNTLETGTRRIMRGDSSNAPYADASAVWEVQTHMSYSASTRTQIAFSLNNSGTYIRNRSSSNWTVWTAMTTNPKIYNATTASGANVVVDSSGQLMRSTSSQRYKDIIADLTLDDVAYANAMQLAPIVYRSTADADNPAYHYYSFSAEKLGAFDPAFTLWRETESVTDADGNTTEQPIAERVAEGININALLAFSHAIAIKQDKMIAAQAASIDALTKRIDELTAQ